MCICDQCGSKNCIKKNEVIFKTIIKNSSFNNYNFDKLILYECSNCHLMFTIKYHINDLYTILFNLIKVNKI